MLAYAVPCFHDTVPCQGLGDVTKSRITVQSLLDECMRGYKGKQRAEMSCERVELGALLFQST